MENNLSRRAFLTSAVAVAAVAAIGGPALATPAAVIAPIDKARVRHMLSLVKEAMIVDATYCMEEIPEIHIRRSYLKMGSTATLLNAFHAGRAIYEWRIISDDSNNDRFDVYIKEYLSIDKPFIRMSLDLVETEVDFAEVL